ncbi:neuropeptide FF receptor 1-like [Dendronephthya gigantea]|uniref:neuropeptide FF receptor 1-like n=1 Tax=Dendronephthya gigantea TaxID=151771 RepID=UPI00106D4575|nr:neuropeptide FF receptor 1-like [Dendronephthya gigantea]XP_028393524.1 neuropeptide FF receptor 1-like [Dendronephthya gigantea]XP_028393526.1 neuropeptide FF receptor 1-like [Dendronephthya gigantea]XP_028393527.1 neuropeptide FF receptor 1-like [Dendronephthya gigantea]XP_028393528.1 neuropeptide FF receptor 1-like [Dendronephthya gigantea]XP_028393529.1 neuropeptide FF receptor 1-like [Dendronephthya gigantea]
MTDHKREMTPLHIWLHVQSAFLGVIFILTLLLNSLLIFVLHKMKSRRSNRDCASYNIERSYMYLVYHLAISDMLGVILNIPFDIFQNAGVAYFFTTAGCKILPPFQLASTTAQAGTYVALSYHRFRAIVHPIRATLTVYKSFIMIAIIWATSICLSMPYVIVHHFNETDGCIEKWKPAAGTIYTFTIFVVQYAGPVMLMAAFYVTIARTLHDHRVAKELVHVPTQEDVRAHRHIVKMLVTIVTVYSVCMLPHHLYWIVIGFQQNVDETVNKAVSSISYLFTYSNSIANPIVFFFYNKESRYHLRRVFKKLFCPRTLDVPFEIKKWSATWSVGSKSESERTRERRSSKDHLKVDKLFPTKPGDSDLGVSLPWEAQVMTSYCSSESYRDYPSSPPLVGSIPEYPTSYGDPVEYTNDNTNSFMFAGEPQGTQIFTGESLVDNDDTGGKDDDVHVEIAECGRSGCDEECVTKENVGVTSKNNQGEVSEENDEGRCDEAPGLGEEDTETMPEAYEDDTARVQHMIERMIQDITQELSENESMNISYLSESLSNSDWEAIVSRGEGLNGSNLAGTSAQDLLKIMTGYQESEKDVNGFRERLEHMPETRM